MTEVRTVKEHRVFGAVLSWKKIHCNVYGILIGVFVGKKLMDGLENEWMDGLDGLDISGLASKRIPGIFYKIFQKVQ